MTESTAQTRKLDEALGVAARRFGHRKNVTGMDLGFRRKDGKSTEKVCVRIHVAEKVPMAELRDGEAFPPDIDGILIDVIRGQYRARPQLGQFVPGSRTAVSAGMACGRARGGLGTISAVVVDRASEALGLLSNWHVLNGPSGASGDPIIVHTTLGPQQVGSLTRSLLGRNGDAAFAAFTARVTWLPVPVGLHHGLTDPRRPVLGETLTKSGAASRVTMGRVDGIGMYRISYETHPGVQEIVEIAGFMLVPGADASDVSVAGDSGATYADPATGAAIGLHIGGESFLSVDEYAIACYMDSALEGLNLRLANFDDLDAATGETRLEWLRAPGLAKSAFAGGRTPWDIPRPVWPSPLPVPFPPKGRDPRPVPLPDPGPGPWNPGAGCRKAMPSGGTVLELQRPTISMWQQIWPWLNLSAAAAVADGWGVSVPLDPAAKLADVLGSGWQMAARQLVDYAPLGDSLRAANVDVTAARLKDLTTFADLVGRLGDLYLAAGWEVTQ